MQLPLAETERLAGFFAKFREGIVGLRHCFTGPCGEQQLLYADWTASGRLYAPIERCLVERFGPLVGNTHSESSTTGVAMTRAYRHAQTILKEHVHAGPDDVIITQGSGMTAVVNKLQRMLGQSTHRQRTPQDLMPSGADPSQTNQKVGLLQTRRDQNQSFKDEGLGEVVEPLARQGSDESRHYPFARGGGVQRC